MSWFGRAGRVVLFAGALVVAVSVGCGGSEEKDPVGGDGGGGAELPCGGRACSQGLSCNEELDRCECTSEPDSCAPFNQVCGPAKTCVIPPPQQQPPVEFGQCMAPNTVSQDQAFICAPLDNGANVWLRLCRTSGQCELSSTVCLPGAVNGDVGFCWLNFCGDEEDENGEPWGACDTNTGKFTSLESATGTCLPQVSQQGTLFLCQAGGPKGIGEPCKVGAPLRDSSACGQDLGCLSGALPPSSCSGDGDCDSSQTCQGSSCVPKACNSDASCGTGNYCLNQKCEPFGRCVEVCNSGSLGADAGPFAGCTQDHPSQSPNPVCTGGVPEGVEELEHFASYCEAGEGGAGGGEGGAGGDDGEGGAGGFGGDEEGAGGAGGFGGDEEGAGGAGGFGGAGGSEPEPL